MSKAVALYERIYDEWSLKAAWLKVKENQGGPGIDHVTCEDFERDLDINLARIEAELKAGSYASLPVLRFYGKKQTCRERPLGIPAVRDRIVQHSVLAAITPLFETQFLECSYAYRPGRSALDAIRKVESLIQNGNHWLLDTDIEEFFDSIDQDLLMRRLSEKINDKKLLRLIGKFLRTGIFEKMQFREEFLGVAQGSVISPILANIFLHPFDEELIKRGCNLVRYADDLVILEKSQEKIGAAMIKVCDILKPLKLRLNEKKTRILNVKEGFVFLGYYIDHRGKGASSKAIEAIHRKIEEYLQTHPRADLQTKIDQIKSIIRGWCSYFSGCRNLQPKDPVAWLAVADISLEQGDHAYLKKLLEGRKEILQSCSNPDILYRAGKLLKAAGIVDGSLHEFSKALVFDPEHFESKEAFRELDAADENVYKTIERLKSVISANPNFGPAYRELANSYAEVGEYGLAKEAYQKALELESDKESGSPEIERCASTQNIPEAEKLELSEEELSLFHSQFRGKAGKFARQWIDEKGRRGFELVEHPLEMGDLKKHFAGEETLGIYIINEEGLVNLGVIDIDIDNQILLEFGSDKERMTEMRRAVQGDAIRIDGVCRSMEFCTVIEDSGYKGRHIWFVFSEPLPPKLARQFLKFVCEKAGPPAAGMHWEIFPNCDKLRADRLGPLIKLPLGIHKRSNRRCFFLNANGEKIQDQGSVLRSIRAIDRGAIESRLIAFAVPDKKMADAEAPTTIKRLLEACTIIKSLTEKAKSTHYLNHYERLSLLYTIGHLGEEGKKYLHKVIGYTINYDYDITEGYIRKKKPNPVSCPKLKERHPDLIVGQDCNCNFKLPRGGYPSPILHAFQSIPREWPPASKESEPARTSQPKKEDLDLKLRKYIEARRQLRGVEKSLERIEAEMAEIFDRVGTDQMETEYGVLRRQKGKNKTEWTIGL